MANCGGPPRQPSGNKSGRKVFCVKFQKELPARHGAVAGRPGTADLRERLDGCLKLWEDRMKMILNEYRSCRGRRGAGARGKHMEDFFFGESAALLPGSCHNRSSNAGGSMPNRKRSIGRAGTAGVLL